MNTETIRNLQPATCNPQPPPKAAGGLKKLNLGGIAKKKDEGKTTYPSFPPNPTAEELAARIASRTDQYEALKSALEVDKAELVRVHVRPWYFQHYHRVAEAPSSVIIHFTTPGSGAGVSPATPPEDGAVRVTVKEQYNKFPDESAFLPVIGEAQVGKYFRQSFELKVDGDKLPSDRAGDLIEELQALFTKYGCPEALESRECVVPVENFKALRLTEMDLAQSLALENVGDKGLTMCTVSTKNVRK